MRKITLAITPELCAMLGITDSADDTAVGAAITAIAKKAAKVDILQGQLNTANQDKTTAETALQALKDSRTTEEVTTMLAKAVEDKKITVEVQAQFAKDYATKPEALKLVLTAMGAYTSVVDQIQTKVKDVKKFEGKSWEELHEAGMIPDLKANHFELYKELWEKEHGCKYDSVAK